MVCIMNRLFKGTVLKLKVMVVMSLNFKSVVDEG